jgi:acyl carrier protein
LTRFPDANRFPPRIKSGAGFRLKTLQHSQSAHAFLPQSIRPPWPASIELGAALRYTGTSTPDGGSGIPRPCTRLSCHLEIYLQYIKGLVMSDTFDQVATIIAETCDIPRDTITPESHAIDDLGIDSLDFLDIAFAIDKAFGIKLPLEKWTQEVNDGKATTEQYFVLKNLSARIDELVAAKGA